LGWREVFFPFFGTPRFSGEQSGGDNSTLNELRQPINVVEAEAAGVLD